MSENNVSSTISVIVPVYNGGAAFHRCLNAIIKANPAPDDIVVVIDGPDENSKHIAQKHPVNIIQLRDNVGPAQARNIGAQQAKGEILFFVDADVEIQDNTIAQVAAQFQTMPDLAALIGSYDDQPDAPNFLSQYKNLFHHYTHQTASEVAFTFWGACGAIRRSAFAAMGGFDATYRHPCIEDIELGCRLTQASYPIRLCKDIQVKHLKCWTVMSLLKAEILYRALPWTMLILRDRTFKADLNLSTTNQFSVVLVFSLMGSLLVDILNPWLGWVTALLAMGLLVMNRAIYQFFYQKRGLLFTLRVIPWHWFYFFYGGATFAYGTLIYLIDNLSSQFTEQS